MADILFCTVYILLFSFIILKSDFYKLPGFSVRVPFGKNVHTLLVFGLKLLFGTLLWYIYAHHYKNRLTSDIFKYFDDSKIIFNCLHSSPVDFIKMLTGIGDTSPATQAYYRQMNSWGNSWGNDYHSVLYGNSHFLIRLNTLFMFFSLGHYGVHVIIMCFISLTGLVYLYKAIFPYISNRHKELFAAVFLFPSVVLWGSGILKEGILFLGLGASVYYFARFLSRNTFSNLLLTALSLLLIFEVKGYVLICILPCFLSEYAIKKIAVFRNYPGVTYLAITVLYLAIGLNINHFGVHINPPAMLATKQQDFNRTTRGGIYVQSKEDSSLFVCLPVEDSAAIIPASVLSDSLLQSHGLQYLASTAFYLGEEAAHRIVYFRLRQGISYKQFHVHSFDTATLTVADSMLYRIFLFQERAKSRINITPIKPTVAGLIAHIPQALVVSMLRPLPNEIHSAMTLFYFIENIIVLTLILFTIIKVFIISSGSPLNVFHYSLFTIHYSLFCFTYCFLMLVIIGLVTPIYGGIERYKSAVMPFLLIGLLFIYDRQKEKELKMG